MTEWNAAEADFQRYYGIDLAHYIWVERASARRINALFQALGPDSASFRAQHPDDWAWGNEHELLAVNAELTDALYRAFFRANSKTGASQPRPIKITRPTQPKRQGTTMDELRVMFPNMTEREL